MFESGQKSAFWTKALLVGAVLLCSICLFLLASSGALEYGPTYQLDKLDAGWTASKNGEELPKSNLSELNTGMLDEGEQVSITRPGIKSDTPKCALLFYTLFSLADVYVGDQLVYSNRHASVNPREKAFSMTNVALIPSDAQGDITIVFTALKDDAFSGVGTIYYGNERDLFYRYLRDHRLPLVLGVFFVLFGFAQILLFPFMAASDRSNLMFAFNGGVTFMSGMYLLSYDNLFSLFSDYLSMSMVVQRMMILFVPLFACGFFACVARGRVRRAFAGIALVDTLVVTVLLVLHILGFISVEKIPLVFFQCVVFATGVPIVWAIVRSLRSFFRRGGMRQGNVFAGLLALGIAIGALCSMGDVLLHTYFKYGLGRDVYFDRPFYLWGSTIFVMLTLIAFFMSVIEHSREKSVRGRLERLAYTDPLTGLAGRGRCEEVLGQLDETGSSYVVISLDLNDLKKVNDTQGHPAGDRLLCGFADELRLAFHDADLLGRMGGDEFVVVKKNASLINAEDRIDRLQRQLSRKVLGTLRLSPTVSAGCAGSDEFPEGSCYRDVYMMADKRMYDRKQAFHLRETANASVKPAASSRKTTLHDDSGTTHTEEGAGNDA